HRNALEYAATDRRHLRLDRVLGDRPGRHQLVDGEPQRNPRARDRRGAGSTVGLNHVAIEHDLPLAELGEVGHGAERTADQPLDLLRPPALLALGRLALTPRMGGTGKHRVLGRYPPLALAAQERRHLLLDARRDQYARVAESDQHRSFGVLGETGEYLDGAHFVGRAAGWSHGGFQPGDSFSDFALVTRYAAVMTSPPVSELTERARAIFRLVVEGYLDSGHPVGSKTLAEGGIN